MAEKPTDIAVREMVYEMANGDEMKLTMNMVRRFLVQGKSEFITESELMYFMHECKARKLNPFLRQCWLIKYSSNDNAQIVESIHHKRAKARRSPDCKGWSKGIIVKGKDGEIKDSMGLLLEGDTLLGGFFEATPEGWNGPWRLEVNLSGYVKKTVKGALTRFWSEENQPAQIAKVAESQGLSALWGDTVGTAVIPGEVSPGEDVIDMEFTDDGYTPPAPEKSFDDLAAEKTKLPNKALDAFCERSAKGASCTVDELKAMAAKDFDGFWGSFKDSIKAPKEKLVSDWDKTDWQAWIDTWKAKGATFVGISKTEKFLETLKVAPDWVKNAHMEKWTRDTMHKHVGSERWPLAPEPEEVEKALKELEVPDEPPVGDPPFDPGPQPPAPTPGQNEKAQEPFVPEKRTVGEMIKERDSIANKIANGWNPVDIDMAMDYLEIIFDSKAPALDTLMTKSRKQVNDILKVLEDNETKF